jgi:hypothetical protein
MELMALRGDTEIVMADMGAYSAAFSYGAAVGSLPLRGFTMSSDGRSFLSSVLRPKSDIWLMDRRR